MNSQFDETTLSSYVDGELDADTMREVEAYIEHNAAGRRYVLNAIRTTALMRASMNEALHEEIPTELIDTIKDDGITQRRKQRSMQLFFRLAATIVLIFAGFSAGNFWNQINTTQMPILSTPLPTRYGQVVNEALEYKLSGASLNWQSPQEPIRIIITPVKTYRDKTGRFYREFKMALFSDGEQSQVSGLAYRAGSGKWKTTALFF